MKRRKGKISYQDSRICKQTACIQSISFRQEVKKFIHSLL